MKATHKYTDPKYSSTINAREVSNKILKQI